MASEEPARRPEITVLNGTRRAVWIAVYKRSPPHPEEPPVAWQVLSIPSRGTTTILAPGEYQVCARYSFEPDDPRRPVYQTNLLQVPPASPGAGFVIEGVTSRGRRAQGAILVPADDRPGWKRLRILNRFSIGVWSHVRQDGRDVFPPRILPPKGACTEEMSPFFHVAVLPLPRRAGDRLPACEIALTEISVRAGEQVKIQGGPYKGFRISRLTGKAQAKPKRDRKQRAAARKPASRKRPASSPRPGGKAGRTGGRAAPDASCPSFPNCSTV